MEEIIKASGVIDESIVDGPGVRYVVFTQGCPHHCPGCHNPQTHSFDGGKQLPISRVVHDVASNPMISGVTFSGGEPICQPKVLAHLAKQINALGKNVIIYSGYTFEQLRDMHDDDVNELLGECKYLIDGKFDQNHKSMMSKFRGSLNQRIIDLQTSLAVGDAVEIAL